RLIVVSVPLGPGRYDGKHCLYAYAFSRACRHLPDQQRGSPATRPSNRTSGEHVVKSAVENLEPTRAKLTVEVPLDELQPSVDHAYSHIASQINVPGFRKGKVPPRIIDQRVGKGAVMEQAINDAMPDLYRQAITETELGPRGQPQVEVTSVPGLSEDAEQLVFTAEVDVRPDFTLPELSEIKRSEERRVGKECKSLRGSYQ